MNVFSRFAWADERLASFGRHLRSPLLLAIRLYWGWQFFVTGRGKLADLDRTAEFFSSLALPLPKLNAVLAGSTECFGGLLLLLGVGSRVVSIPLIFTMLVAYATTEREAIAALWSDSDQFVTAAPFVFLFAAVLVLVFGPGKFSVDALLLRRAEPEMRVAS